MVKRSENDTFLADCEPCFLDGVLTVAEFTRRTQELVHDALSPHLPLLVQALGFQRTTVAPSDYCCPDKLWSADPAAGVNLGAKFKATDAVQVWFYRYWEFEPRGTGIGAGIWIKGREKTDRLGEALDSAPIPWPKPGGHWDSSLTDGGYDIWRTLDDSEVPKLAERLDELIRYYIRLLRKVGGARKFLR